MIEFVKPTMGMIESIAEDMRQSDIDEVWASNHHTPLESLVQGWEVSDFSSVVTYDGEPMVMFGLVRRNVLSGSGVIWMLGTNRSMKYRRKFLTETKHVIDEMLTICPYLCNMVHSKNTNSIQWLKWLGFTIDEPVPYGPDSELFHRFYIQR